MKRICFVFCFLLAGIIGIAAQKAVDSLPAAGVQLSFQEDSLRREALTHRAQIAGEMAKADIRHFVIRVADHTFGYTVFIDGQVYIEQESIPAISGNAGFATQEDAEHVAKFVIEKIKLGDIPPTVTMEDLRALKVVD